MAIPQLALHHIGVATERLDDGLALYRKVGAEPVTRVYEDPLQKVRVQFVSTGSDVLIELVEPLDENGPIGRHLRKHGPGLYHLCYSVDSLDQVCRQARDAGAVVVCEPVAAVAFDQQQIAFVYWRGGLIEFLEMRRSE